MMKDQPEIQRILDHVQSRVREHGWSNVAEEERDASNVDAFYGSVVNGGIDSLFFNSPYLGDMADELLESLERVGAMRAAKLLRESFTFFPNGRVPPTLDARIDCLRKSKEPDPFAILTRRFYTEAEREEIVLLEFFRRNPKHFGLLTQEN